MTLVVLDQYGDIGGGQQAMIELVHRLPDPAGALVLAPSGPYLDALGSIGARTQPWHAARPHAAVATVAHEPSARHVLVNGGRALHAAVAIRAWRTARRRRLPITFVQHSSPATPSRARLLRCLRHGADFVAPVACSQHRPGALALPGLGLTSRFLERCPTTAPVTGWTGAIKAFGRLDPVKGLDVLAAALPHLVPAGLDRCVEVAVRPAMDDGAGDYESEVRAALVDVLVTGSRDSTWFRPGDVVVISSRSEAVCLTAQEAMASGALVVGPDVGDLPSLVDERFLFPPGDPTALAAAIARAADLPGSEFAAAADAGRARALERADAWYDALLAHVDR